MALDDLPKRFQLPTRDEVHRRWLRDAQLRQPAVDVSEDTQPWIDGSIVADQLMPLYSNAANVGNDADLDQKTSKSLEAEALRLGIPARLPASGGAGTVLIGAAAGGVTLLEGDEIKDPLTNYRYTVTTTATYLDGNPVPIIGVDVGPGTNLAAGTTLSWTSPPPGLTSTAPVIATADGRGLVGGRDQETDSELRQRIADARKRPAASGNEADVRSLVKAAGVAYLIAVQDAFAFSAGAGAGTFAFCFTLRPAAPGGSRAPGAASITTVAKYLEAQLPRDYSIFKTSVVEQGQSVVLKVRWRTLAAGWADAVTFPPYQTTLVKVTAASSALAFTVDGAVGPQVGQRIAFYDVVNGKFIRKTIGTVGGSSGAWTITCTTAGGASDASYFPSIDEPLCPWSDSLADLRTPIVAGFDLLGPGEQRQSFFDPGYRQRRAPVTPEEWPSDLTTRSFNGLDDVVSIRDWQVAQPTLPLATPVGTTNVSSFLMTLGRLLAFPL